MNEARLAYAARYSPLLLLATSTSFKHHVRLPNGLVACGRRIKDESKSTSVRTYVEQFGDHSLCPKCVEKLGPYRDPA